MCQKAWWACHPLLRAAGTTNSTLYAAARNQAYHIDKAHADGVPEGLLRVPLAAVQQQAVYSGHHAPAAERDKEGGPEGPQPLGLEHAE